MAKRGYIFLSYAREDVNWVSEIKSGLRNAGIQVWRDVAISPGTEWHIAIREALKGCVAFVPFISPHFINSIFCQNELFYALAEKKPIIPIWVFPKNHVDHEKRYEIPDYVTVYQAILLYSGTPFTKFEYGKNVEVIDPIYNAETYSRALDALIVRIENERVNPPPTPYTDESKIIAQLRASTVFQWLVYTVLACWPGLVAAYCLCFYCTVPISLGVFAHASYYWLMGQRLSNKEIQRWSKIAGTSAIVGPIVAFVINIGGMFLRGNVH